MITGEVLNIVGKLLVQFLQIKRKALDFGSQSIYTENLIVMFPLRAKFISAEERTGVTFDDFAGQEYIKKELQEIVRILKNDDDFQDKGIYCPKGVLLHGPPGTGKTLLAKAIAGEAGLPFFAANGTDFVEVLPLLQRCSYALN